MDNNVKTLKNTENTKPNLDNEVNKVPLWSQRCAAGTIDVGILLVLFFIFVALINMTPLGGIAGGYQKDMATVQKDVALTPLDVEGEMLTYGEVEYLTDENRGKYQNNFIYKDENQKEFVVIVKEQADKETSQKVFEKFKETVLANKVYQTAKFNYRFVSYGINMIAVTISEAILILIIPLMNKRRATMGQILAGETCVNSKLETKARWWKIVIRYFWVMIIEVALPCLSFLGMYALIVVPFVLYLVALLNKNKRTLRDYVSATRFIDSKSQMKIGHEE